MLKKQKIIFYGFILFTVIITSVGLVTALFSKKLKIGADVNTPSAQQNILTKQGVTYKSTLDKLNLKMDITYDSNKSHAPIMLILHGYKMPITNMKINQRMAKKGLFTIKTYKRGFGGSEGVSDDSARETYDFIDAIEYVKRHYSQYVDVNNINVVGYSGGGGNVYSLITKFPDYFRTATIYFGMSDYGYSADGWYYNGASRGEEGANVSDYRPIITQRVGGRPDQVPENYHARAMYLGAKNNPFTKIFLFYDKDEKVCPIDHAEQFIKEYSKAGYNNLSFIKSDENTYTYELVESFDSQPLKWLSKGSYSNLAKYSGERIYFESPNTNEFSAYSKQFTSLRKYGLKDNIQFEYNFKISSAPDNSAILFGLRRNLDTQLRNAISVYAQQSGSMAKLYLRADYNGAANSSSNQTKKMFPKFIKLGETYQVSVSMKNYSLYGVLKDSSGKVLSTLTMSLDKTKILNEFDYFGIYSSGASQPGGMKGTFDNLKVKTQTRWYHAYPVEGSSTGENNIVAENYFIRGIVSGKYSVPKLKSVATMFIPGYIKTSKFRIMLDNGRTKAGEFKYDIRGDADTYANKKQYSINSFSGKTKANLLIYNLKANRSYYVKVIDMRTNQVYKTKVSTNQYGNLSASFNVNKLSRVYIYR